MPIKTTFYRDNSADSVRYTFACCLRKFSLRLLLLLLFFPSDDEDKVLVIFALTNLEYLINLVARGDKNVDVSVVGDRDRLNEK